MPRTLRTLLLNAHRLLRVKQDEDRADDPFYSDPLDTDTLIRRRIRSLRAERGWSLDHLAAQCGLSPSTLSRIETGHRRIALDQLVPLARALGTSLDALVDPVEEDV